MEIIFLFFVGNLSTRAHGLSRVASSGARVGLGSLAARRQAFLMAGAAIAFDILESFNIARDFAFEIAFDFYRLDDFPDGVLLDRSNFLSLDGVGDFSLVKNTLGAGATHAVKRRQGDFDSFVIRKCYTENAHNKKNKTRKIHVCVFRARKFTLT